MKFKVSKKPGKPWLDIVRIPQANRNLREIMWFYDHYLPISLMVRGAASPVSADEWAKMKVRARPLEKHYHRLEGVGDIRRAIILAHCGALLGNR